LGIVETQCIASLILMDRVFFVMVPRFGVAPTQCNTSQINDKRVHIVSR
jgi:hypothetical protein